MIQAKRDGRPNLDFRDFRDMLESLADGGL